MKPNLHEIRKTFRFEAAHFLPRLPETHPCSRIHGHSYEVTLIVRGELNPQYGWVMDFSEIKKIASIWIDRLDHRLLNETEGLENPTSEILAEWFYHGLKPALTALVQIVVCETCTSETRYPASTS